MGEGYTTAINFHMEIQSIKEMPVSPWKPISINSFGWHKDLESIAELVAEIQFKYNNDADSA